MTRDVFDGTRTPRLPADLRERALRAARAAATEAHATGRAVWGFRRLDLVWASALLLLVVGNAWLTFARRAATVGARRSTPAPVVEAAARPQEDPELIALGVRLDAGSARPKPSLTLGQVLRAGS